MPRILELGTANTSTDGLDELHIAGEIFFLMAEPPLGLIQDLQAGVAAATAIRKKGAKGSKTTEAVEAEAVQAVSEHVTFDVFALAFHPSSREAFNAAMRGLPVSEVAKLFEFILNREAGGTVPLDAPAPSSPSPEAPQSNSKERLSMLAALTGSENSAPAEPSPGLPAASALSPEMATTTKSVLASSV